MELLDAAGHDGDAFVPTGLLEEGTESGAYFKYIHVRSMHRVLSRSPIPPSQFAVARCAYLRQFDSPLLPLGTEDEFPDVADILKPYNSIGQSINAVPSSSKIITANTFDGTPIYLTRRARRRTPATNSVRTLRSQMKSAHLSGPADIHEHPRAGNPVQEHVGCAHSQAIR